MAPTNLREAPTTFRSSTGSAVRTAPRSTDFDRLSGINHADDKLDDVTTAVAHTFAELVGVNRCAVFMRDNADESFRVRTWLAETDYTGHLRGMVNGEDPFTTEILNRREPVVIADSLSDPRVAQHYEISRRCGVHSMLGLPLTYGDEVIGLAFLDDVGKSTQFSGEQLNRAVQFATVCGVALEQSRALEDSLGEMLNWRRDAMQHRQLLTAAEHLDELIRNRSVTTRDFALAGTAVLGRPVEIVDATWHVVAHAQPRCSESRRIGQLSDERVRSHAKVQPLLNRAIRDGQPCVIPPLPALGVDLRCLVAPITSDQNTLGHIIVHESGRPFSAFDHRTVSSIARRAGTAPCGSSGSGTRAQLDRNACLAAALQDVPTADGTTISDADLPPGPYLLCVLGGIGIRSVPQPARELVEAMTFEVTGNGTACFTEHDNRLVALLPVQSDVTSVIDGIRPLVERAAAESYSLQRLTLAVSRPFDSLSSCLRAHDEAQQVLRAVRCFENPEIPRVISADDLGASLAFLSSADVAEARRFALAYAGPVLQQANHHELLTTLRAFLGFRNVVRCARTLGVHENTVRYRLSKIESLTGQDLLNDTDTQVRASLAVQVLRMTGDCPW